MKTSEMIELATRSGTCAQYARVISHSQTNSSLESGLLQELNLRFEIFVVHDMLAIAQIPVDPQHDVLWIHSHATVAARIHT